MANHSILLGVDGHQSFSSAGLLKLIVGFFGTSARLTWRAVVAQQRAAGIKRTSNNPRVFILFAGYER